MKIRFGFVSNSSSSSFILSKEGLTQKQINNMREYFDTVASAWGETDVEENDKTFSGDICYHVEPCLSDKIAEENIAEKNLRWIDDEEEK